jgi:hypothetical protein
VKRSALRRYTPIRQRKPRGLSLVSDWKKRLDKLCREVVMLRDQGACQWCGRTQNLQWAHINSRRFLSTRWTLANSCLLCSGCHLKWHHRPLEAATWFAERFPDRAAQLQLLSRAGGKTDPHGVFIWLTQEKKRLGGAA